MIIAYAWVLMHLVPVVGGDFPLSVHLTQEDCQAALRNSIGKNECVKVPVYNGPNKA